MLKLSGAVNVDFASGIVERGLAEGGFLVKVDLVGIDGHYLLARGGEADGVSEGVVRELGKGNEATTAAQVFENPLHRSSTEGAWASRDGDDKTLAGTLVDHLTARQLAE